MKYSLPEALSLRLRFYLGFLAKVRNEVDSGVVIFLEAVDDLIAASVSVAELSALVIVTARAKINHDKIFGEVLNFELSSIHRGLAPSGGPTTPSRSICSIIRRRILRAIAAES